MSDAIYWPSAPALILATQLPSAGALPAPHDLRQRIIDVLDRMVGAARAARVPEAEIAEARYALVAFIDEQILKSSWPGRVEWMNQPLQLTLYREVTAGENFFARMRALLNHGGHEFALEIYYLCLALGFRGAYGVSGNPAALASFADAARERIAQRLPSAAKLSPSALPRDRAREARGNRGALIGLIAGCVVVVLAVLIGLRLSLHIGIRDAVQAMPAKAASSAH
ncbi:MAG TPA: DotU family type IV/VI secretion system protein [Polyangiaceae bacterium]|jgi:type VI secretion system protein ImpK|nr:DotU family type IV/VI secretion system protein [Polyangiaceae bacterium]